MLDSGSTGGGVGEASGLIVASDCFRLSGGAGGALVSLGIAFAGGVPGEGPSGLGDERGA